MILSRDNCLFTYLYRMTHAVSSTWWKLWLISYALYDILEFRIHFSVCSLPSERSLSYKRERELNEGDLDVKGIYSL